MARPNWRKTATQATAPSDQKVGGQSVEPPQNASQEVKKAPPTADRPATHQPSEGGQSWLVETMSAALVEQKKPKKESFLVSMDSQLRHQMDRARGGVSRSKFLSELVKLYLASLPKK